MGGSVTDGKMRACLAVDEERVGNPALQSWDRSECRTREGLVPVGKSDSIWVQSSRKVRKHWNCHASKHS